MRRSQDRVLSDLSDVYLRANQKLQRKTAEIERLTTDQSVVLVRRLRDCCCVQNVRLCRFDALF